MIYCAVTENSDFAAKKIILAVKSKLKKFLELDGKEITMF